MDSRRRDRDICIFICIRDEVQDAGFAGSSVGSAFYDQRLRQADDACAFVGMEDGGCGEECCWDFIGDC